MAANKFATMLHRNTNKITLVLVYAILEWILIILLLLNSLFSYLIIKYADFFGLKRPCIWCTRIDHIIEPGKNKNPCRDIVCEAHATEISKLDFCSKHLKLAESQDMCEDCSTSTASQPGYVSLSQSFGFFPWMNQIGMNMIKDCDGDKGIEKVDDETLRCSCCGVNLDKRFYPPCFLVKPSSRNILEYPQKQNLITEGGVSAEINEGDDESDHTRSDIVLDHHGDKHDSEENRGTNMVFEVDLGREEYAGESCGCSVCDGVKKTLADEIYKLDLGVENIQDETFNVLKDGDEPSEQNTAKVDCTDEMIHQISPIHLEFFIHGDDCRLVPVELVESSGSATETVDKHNGYKGEDEDFILDFDMHADAEADSVVENWHMSGVTDREFSCQENKEEFSANEAESIQLRNREKSLDFEGEEDNLEQNYHALRFCQTAEELHKVDNVQANMERRVTLLLSDHKVTDSNPGNSLSTCGVSEDATQMQGEEFEAEVSIGTEIPDQDQVDEYQWQDTLLDRNKKIEDQSTYSGQDKSEEFLEFKTMPLEVRIPTMTNHLTSSSLELHENEEEKVPDTPTSVGSMYQLHRKLLLLERKESGTEDSFDGSVMSDLECGEVTIEKLKSALKSERKALSTLYAELEEERNASAIAANQTMAMINRLQEEKASMQMEALQYQRMMDEQCEYDQEALQILNELMVKREKEKQQLEKELEIYRKKVHEYEVREKMIMSRREGSSIRSRNSSSPSCSNAEESDGLSIDLNHDTDEFYSHQECSNQNTPVNAIMYLENSLENFEEERLSILERIKVLEEKLVILNYEDELRYDDAQLIEHLCEENGNGYHEHGNGKENGYANGKHHEGRNIIGTKAKRLLPLFNAISTEEAEEDVELSGDENELEFSPLQNGSSEKFHLDKKKVALEREVDHVYERLQVLEADREFLKHCFISLRKGDKGLDILQEILQHLRDLRNVEFRARNTEDLAV